jgi:hypothetical protein
LLLVAAKASNPTKTMDAAIASRIHVNTGPVAGRLPDVSGVGEDEPGRCEEPGCVVVVEVSVIPGSVVDDSLEVVEVSGTDEFVPGTLWGTEDVVVDSRTELVGCVEDVGPLEVVLVEDSVTVLEVCGMVVVEASSWTVVVVALSHVVVVSSSVVVGISRGVVVVVSPPMHPEMVSTLSLLIQWMVPEHGRFSLPLPVHV